MNMLSEAETYRGDAAVLIPPPGGKVRFCGLNPASTAFVLAEAIRRRPDTFVVFLPTPVEAEDFVRDMEFFWPEGAAQGRILLLPGYEIKPFGGESPSPDLVFSRLWALYNMISGQHPLVVAVSAPGAMQLSMPKQVLAESVELVESGQEVDREGLTERLASWGYYPTGTVQSQGDFSVRGGIMDIFPPGAERPVRAEFFGDMIESLRTFRTMDQRSVDDVSEQILLPASEVIYEKKRNGLAASSDRAAAALKTLSEKHGWLDLLWAPLVDKIESGMFFPGLESFLPLFYDRLSPISDFINPGITQIMVEPERFASAAGDHMGRLERHMERILAEERPHLPLSELYLDPEALAESLFDQNNIEVMELPLDNREVAMETVRFQVDDNRDLRAMMTGARESSAGLLAPLAARIKSWLRKGLTACLACHTKEQAVRMAELLADYDLQGAVITDGRIRGDADGPSFRLLVGFLSSGFVMAESGLALVTEDELFGPKRGVRRRAAEEVKGVHLSSFQDLGVGDFVVHTEHGIGQYLGLVSLDAGDTHNDYLHLAYKGNDKLYVPVERFGAVTKYVGADGRHPPLDKLGGTSWEKVKARVKAHIREMADELLKLYAQRQVKQGITYSPRDSYLREFEASFEYDETPDQMSAIEDVLSDMASSKPMDRLVCGDVGYGKTEVALRACFKAISDGKQVAVLVPTTVLAEQHYQTFRQRLENHPVVVDVLSRFKKPAAQKEILKNLGEGRVDVIVGTHRLLQKDVSFKDLGLLIIDEEHRFGVAAKEKLKKARSEVDVLTLSATPIPRTMHMSLNGIRDLSVIETPPRDRQSIKTYLLKYDESTVCEAIANELDRGGQVFFVHNRVRDIEMMAMRLRQLMPLVKFGIAHGQMKERELEKVMLGFMKKEVDVLITTTIIESGLDFPSANTIIVNNADRFGLAQMYQLRGRVGRSNEQAFAYLFVQSSENLTRDARKRLRALLDFSNLGAGFKIALHDLQIRGAGNLLGAAQSGQIAAVGYEMYVQLMEKTVQELKGEDYVEEIEPEMVLGVASFIPESYVPDTEARLVHYRRMSSAKNGAELEDVAAELLDRYGPLPVEVENLLQVMEIKVLLKKLGAVRLEVGGAGLTVTFTEKGPRDPEKVLDLVQTRPNRVKLSPDGRLFLADRGFGGFEGLKRIKNILHGLC